MAPALGGGEGLAPLDWGQTPRFFLRPKEVWSGQPGIGGGFGFGFFFCARLGDGRAGRTPSPGSEGPRGTLHPEGFKVGQGNGTGCSAI